MNVALNMASSHEAPHTEHEHVVASEEREHAIENRILFSSHEKTLRGISSIVFVSPGLCNSVLDICVAQSLHDQTLMS